MAMTYLLLNLAVIAAVVIVLRWRQALVWNRAVSITLGVLLLTTVLFDSIMVSSGIVAYSASHIIGIQIGTAPVEDFFYAVLAAIVVPAVWEYTKKRSSDE